MIQNSNAAEEMEMVQAMDWLVSQAGFPTFDEFKKNPDRYRQRSDELLELVDASTQTFRKALTKQKYFWKDQYRCDSLEHLERICKEEGYSPLDLEMEPKVRPVNGTSTDGDMEVVVHFWPKAEFRERGGIVAND